MLSPLHSCLCLITYSCLSSIKCSGSGSGCNLSSIADISLSYLRELISQIRMRDYNKESWQFWCNKTGSAQLVRQASTATCILNEMVYGLSDRAVENFKLMFQNPASKREEYQKAESVNQLKWDIPQDKGARSQLIDCVGRILHEYLAAELWNLPLEPSSSLAESDGEAVHVPFHFFNDIAMLQQERYMFLHQS